MSAVGLAARAELRRRPAATAGLAVLVALAVGMVLATVAGARRTTTVVDRYLEATNARDLSAFVVTIGADKSIDGRDLADRIDDRLSELPGVREVGTGVGYPTAASEEFDVTVVASPDDSMYRTIDEPILLDGRLPDAGSAREVAINEPAAKLLEFGVGDVIEAPTFSPDDCGALAAGSFPGFNGPTVSLEVVGRVRLGDDLRGDEAVSGPLVIAGHGFLEEYGGDTCATVVFAAIRSAPDGPSVADVQAALDKDTVGLEKGLVSTVGDDYATTARAAASSVSTVLWLAAAVAALGGLIAAGQALRRQTAAGAHTDLALEALGLSRMERSIVVATPAIVAVAAGVAVGIVGAWAMSSASPPSLARVIEPSPGRELDAAVLLGGAAVLLLAGVAWAVVAARRAALSLHGASPRPSRAVDLAARVGLRPPSLIGVRMAYEAGPAGGRVPGRSAVAGAAVAVIGVIAVLVVATSTDEAIDEPRRFGWTWTAMPDVEVDDVDALLAAVETSPVVRAAGRLVGGAVEVEGHRLQAIAMEDLQGSTTFVVTDGRLPTSADEIALGGGAMEDLGTSIGERVAIEGPDGDERRLTVVGQVILPLVNDINNPGSGAAMTVDALETLARGEAEDDLVVTYAAGADPVRAQRGLEDLGLLFPGYSRPQVPGQLLNLQDVQAVFVALAGFLVLLGVAGLAHALAVSARRRRLDFAVLRSIGFLRRHVRLVMWWQALAIMAAACAIGVPLGFVVGRLTWRAVIADLHMVDTVASPLGSAALTVGAALVLAGLLSVLPAVLATRHRLADLLRTE